MTTFALSFLIQLILYLLLWLYDDYLALVLSLIFGSIAFFIWLLSYVFEFIEKTRITRTYFWLMLSSFLAPLCGLLFYSVFGGGFGWLE